MGFQHKHPTREPRPPFLQRATSFQLFILDLLAAFLLLMAALPRVFGWPSPIHRFDASAAILALLLAAAVAIRRRAALPALIVATLAIGIGTLLGQSFAPDPLIAIPMYQIAATRERRVSLPALAAVATTLIAAAVVGTTIHPSEGDVTFSIVLSIASWFVGDSVRTRRVYMAGLANQATQAQREALERANRAVAEERLQIARELHDVVAHSLSVIAIQSGMGRHVIETQPEDAKRALATVETTSRDALDELRRMLGVLRSDGVNDSQLRLAPTPGTSDLENLVAQIRDAGTEVELMVSGEPLDNIPPSLGLSVFRIVQEALTNVVKHANATTARVVIARDANAIEINVTDDGSAASGAAIYVPRIDVFEYGDQPVTDVISHVGHHGITGMRERVAMFNGIFSAGPIPNLGFRVNARLPLVANEPF